MKIFLRFTIVLIPLLFMSHIVNGGGGWPEEKGGYFAKFGQYGIYSKYNFGPGGEVLDLYSPVSYYATTVYGSYGITDKLTGIVNLPIYARATLHATDLNEKQVVQSVGDTDIALKYNFLAKNGWVASAQLTAGLPLGKSGNVQTGDGEFNQMIEVIASKGLNNGYYSFQAGFNNRTSGFVDEVRWGIEGGLKKGNFWGILRVLGVNPLRNQGNPQVETVGLFGNNVKYLAVSPEISYSVSEKWGFSVGAGFAAYGENILASPTFNAGIFIKG